MAGALPAFDVYLDESFYQFWGFANPAGNFCYGVFGLPRHQESALKVFHSDLLSDFQSAVRKEFHKDPPGELKSHIFPRLPFNTRRRLGLQLAGFMRTSRSFLLADFCEVRGFILEKIRSDLAKQGQGKLPEDWQSLYEKRKEDLVQLASRGKAGQAPILNALMGTPISGLGFFLTTRAEKYQVVFDPRDPNEDPEVAQSIREFTEVALRAVHGEEPGRFEGVAGDHTSEQMPGLQIADLLVGEVRNWFISRPEYVSFASSLDLVTESNANATFLLATRRGYLPKRQRITKLPDGLAKRLLRADENSILPFFRNFLAKGLLSCVAYWGEFRHINFADSTIIDSLDDWEAATAS